MSGHPGWEVVLFVASSAGAWVDDPCLPGETLDSLVVLYLRWAGPASGMRSTRRLCWSSAGGWRMLSSRVVPFPVSLATVLRATAPPLPDGLPEAVEEWLPLLTPGFLLALEVIGS